MEAEQLIAFEGALAELSGLYLVAKDFRPLSTRAESELLAATAELGSRLRRFVRQDRADEGAIDAAARDIAALRDEWRSALSALRASDLYQSCLAAYAAVDSDRLIRLIPQLFADCRHAGATPSLYYALSPSSGRRRPGNSPFLTATACAARVDELRRDGLVVEGTGKDWWETELVPLMLTADPVAFDTPLALRFDPGQIPTPVFRVSDGEVFRIFTPRLQAPFTVVLQDDVDDEWWQAFAGSYAMWRDSLAAALRAATIPVMIWSSEGDQE